MVDQIKDLGNWCLGWLPKTTEVQRIVVSEVKMVTPRAGQAFTRMAGLSGALAVGFGAYGAHAFANREDVDPKLKLTFDTGNRYHMLHSIVLLAVPCTRRPGLVGPLILLGTALFSGSCYYHALTGDTRIRKVTPYGGMLLIAGWVAMIL
ncbi:unnamed protein product [Owenia fusiformis]|uniref:Uncharacterized protein n=1 Tax=Owenia fusiformis TaxID=6347 RepID=A0A8J1YBK0_OWEFU|nr:unnamed protein product [Owenia fusiformis]